jgi:hypothetical protein
MAGIEDINGDNSLFKVNFDAAKEADEVLNGQTGEGVLFGAVDGARDKDASEILDEPVKNKNEIVVAGEKEEEQDKVLEPAKVWVVDETGRYRNIPITELKPGQVQVSFVDGDSVPRDGDMDPSFVRNNKERVLTEENKSDFVNVRVDLKKLSNNRDKQNISEEIIERMTRENGLNFSGIPGVDYFGSDNHMRAKAENGRLQIGWAVNMIDNNGKSVEDGKKTGRFENVNEAKRYLRKIGVKFEGDTAGDVNDQQPENGQRGGIEPESRESEEARKNKLKAEAREYLNNLINTRSNVDASDEVVFRGWVTSHGKYADPVDLTRANALLGEIATRRENRERQKEVEKRQREDDRNRMIDEERKRKEERTENERLERKWESDQRNANIAAERKSEREKREYLERQRIVDRLEAKTKLDAKERAYKELNLLKGRLREIGSTTYKKQKEKDEAMALWLEDLKIFIDANKDIEGNSQLVEQSRALELELLKIELRDLSPDTKSKKIWFKKINGLIDSCKNIPERSALMENAKTLEKEEKEKEHKFLARLVLAPFVFLNRVTGGSKVKYDPKKWK